MFSAASLLPTSCSTRFRSKVDTSTSLPFPLSIHPKSLQTTSPPLSLVGLGVRTVSFLRVKVYCAGFYALRGSWWKNDGMGVGSIILFPGSWHLLISSCRSIGLQSEASMEDFLNSSEPCVLRISTCFTLL